MGWEAGGGGVVPFGSVQVPTQQFFFDPSSVSSFPSGDSLKLSAEVSSYQSSRALIWSTGKKNKNSFIIKPISHISPFSFSV